ncbi:MAG: V-type ATP synthase subunit D [Christensenellaceae bacterium]|jgi:V/A-type H+-transporting ATPase subunit D|nr:V-type ATP synthase subunit D [Christensenellaceae bacterium]
MVTLQVKPTRMELSNLKRKKKVAVRGHKLMKDKRDELVRRFIIYVRRNRVLREQVEEKLAAAMQRFVLARATMSAEAVEEALCYPARPATVEAGVQHVLSIEVPQLRLAAAEGFSYPYGFMTTSAELDGAVQIFSEALPMLMELAEVEKVCNRLADEIEKTRRRVNALEYVMIPQYDEAIRQITMKLDENERGNLIRLMKTKQMIAGRE